MNNYAKHILWQVTLSLFFSLISFFSFSQDDFKIKKTIRGEALLPRPVSNKAFTKIFSGVLNFNASMNFGFRNFNAGPYYNFMQSQIFPKFQDDPHSIQTVHTGGLRFSYDVGPSKETLKSQPENFFVFSPFIAMGYNKIDYSRLLSKNGCEITGKHTQALNIFAGANFNLMLSEWDGFGFTIGYNFINEHFNPDALCLSEYFDFTEDEKRGKLQYFLFGFNVYIDLAKRPSSVENPE
jgi:hypothetical protein